MKSLMIYFPLTTLYGNFNYFFSVKQFVKGYIILWDGNLVENKPISFLYFIFIFPEFFCMFAIFVDYPINPIILQLSYILLLAITILSWLLWDTFFTFILTFPMNMSLRVGCILKIKYKLHLNYAYTLQTSWRTSTGREGRKCKDVIVREQGLREGKFRISIYIIYI